MKNELKKTGIKKIQQLLEHERAAADLRRELVRAMMITILWPKVFDNGPAKSSWKDTRPPEQRSHYKKLVQGVPFHKGHTFVLTDGAGEVREFPFEQVPEILGGGYIDETD